MFSKLELAVLAVVAARGLALTENTIITDNNNATNNSFTSGNLNSKVDLSMVLSGELTEIQLNYTASEEENKTFTFFRELEQNIVADMYGQDPKSFMPEKSGYFRIVENRGIVFIFLSKFLFYIFITLGLLKVVFGYFTSVPKNYVSKVLVNERTVIGKKFQGRLMVIYSCSGFLFLLMFASCMNMIYTASSNKYMFYTTGIRLKSLNTELLSQMNEANKYLNLVNSAKLVLRNSSNSTDQFVVRNNLPALIDSMKNFSTNASEFNKNILTNTILVKISIPLFCLFITFVVFIGSLTSLRVRSNQISTSLYFVSVIVGSFCMMMANYQISSIFMFTDICDQMRLIMTPGQKMANEGGVKQYLTCLDHRFQANVTDQLGNLLTGEYTLLEQINFELQSIRNAKPLVTDKNVSSIGDALSRTFQETDVNLVYYRDNYVSLANLTNIVKKKLLRLPNCYYLNDWGKDFNKQICREGLKSGYRIYQDSIFLSIFLYLNALLMFYIDRFIAQLKEKDRVENIQLYMRIPTTQNPLYRLNGVDK